MGEDHSLISGTQVYAISVRYGRMSTGVRSGDTSTLNHSDTKLN